jgi:hypothetical protein
MLQNRRQKPIQGFILDPTTLNVLQDESVSMQLPKRPLLEKSCVYYEKNQRSDRRIGSPNSDRLY